MAEPSPYEHPQLEPSPDVDSFNEKSAEGGRSKRPKSFSLTGLIFGMGSILAMLLALLAPLIQSSPNPPNSFGNFTLEVRDKPEGGREFVVAPLPQRPKRTNLTEHCLIASGLLSAIAVVLAAFAHAHGEPPRRVKATVITGIAPIVAVCVILSAGVAVVAACGPVLALCLPVVIWALLES